MINTVTTDEGRADTRRPERRPLAALVRSRHEAGRSYRDMAEAARRAGHTISHSQLQAYATDMVRKAPTNEQLAALAAAIGVTFARARAAMMEQFYGYVPRGMEADDPALPGARIGAAIPPDLSPEQEQQLLRMVQAWIASQE